MVSLLFAAHYQVGAPVFLPARFIVFSTEWAILAIRNRGNPGRRDTQISQEILGGVGPPLTQSEVVFLAATIIAMPFDREIDAWVRLEEIRILG